MQINKKELLRYLRYNNQKIDENLDKKIDKAIEICLEYASPKNIVKKYKLDRENKKLEGTTFVLKGEDIWKHLDGCDEVYLFAATIGFGVEKQIARYFIEDKTLAILLDSAATCAIESYCDEVCDTLDGKLTYRYSCGYGDFPLDQQKEFCNLMDTFRKIGVFVAPSFMMSPQKSVTAIIGIKNEI